MIKKIYIYFTKIFLRLHSFSYKLSSLFAIRSEDGLHPKHRLTRYHRYFINNINKNDRVLDIGCGNGSLSFDLSKKAKKVVGIDLNKESIDSAKNKYPALNIEYIFGNAVDYQFSQKFDIIVLSNVLEHIRNRQKFLKKISKIAPKILIRVPMIDRDWITVYKKELGIEWKLDELHYTEYTFENFTSELKKAGLKISKHSIQFGEIWAEVKSK